MDAILEAAAKIFVADGYDAATTNRIAEAAGTSVGSVYQYFPSKDAIAVELARRFRAARLEFVRTELAAVGHKPVGTVIRTLFTSFLKAEGIRPELYRVLIDRVMRTAARNDIRGYEERLEALVTEALRRITPPPRVHDIELAAFMVVRLVLALVHSANADRPRYNTPALASELTRLVVAYLGVAPEGPA